MSSALLFLPLLSVALLFLAREIRNCIRRQKHGTAQLHGEKTAGSQKPYKDIEPLNDFDWASTSPIRNAPLKPKYHLTMGKNAFNRLFSASLLTLSQHLRLFQSPI